MSCCYRACCAVIASWQAQHWISETPLHHTRTLDEKNPVILPRWRRKLREGIEDALRQQQLKRQLGRTNASSRGVWDRCQTLGASNMKGCVEKHQTRSFRVLEEWTRWMAVWSLWAKECLLSALLANAEAPLVLAILSSLISLLRYRLALSPHSILPTL